MPDPLAEFVIEELPHQVEQFADALERGSITLTSTRSRLRFEFTHGPRSLERMTAVLATWRRAGGTEPLLVQALRGQLAVRQAVENRGPRCELVWTGNTTAAAGVRSTFPVVTEMLSWARRSVLVVTYSLWIGADVQAVIDRLAELSSTGVDITFVLDRRYQEGWNVSQLKQRWPPGRRKPALYTWQHEDDAIAKLHAKVLIVDRRDLLITSANLTAHGMKGNLEFGLRVLGRPAEDASRHFESLIRSGTFEEEAWP
ncbi:MAG TPA: DISARM system phospholipase D-like protein DrmC [Streptosporangiaceae bacterium]|nr:DISARM system phospholipase D-like protein DrmC [Streptosporangiaceae bacterium]